MKSRLAKIVSGEYISSPMINFLSSALAEQQDNFVNAVFRGSGIISAFGTDGIYDTSLRVVAGSNNNIVVSAGVFVSPSGKVISVPRTETNIQVRQLNKIFIRYKQTIFVPDVTISGNQGSLQLSYSNESILDYICPGMAILTESMYNRGQYTGIKIASVGSFITLDSPLPANVSNEKVIIVPKFITGVSTLDASCVYRFDSYEILDEASLTAGQAVGDDWILLATVTYSDADYQINNIRVSSERDLSEDLTNEVYNYLPNVASLATTFSDDVQYLMRLFFTEGVLQIGTETKNIYLNSHEQNTDEGTINNFFDIALNSTRKFRIGDAGEAEDYLIRLFSNASMQRSYELPNGESTNKDSINVNLLAKQIPEQLQAMFASIPSEARISGSTIILNSKSNIFSVSGAGDIKSIVVEGTAANYTGQTIVLKFNSRVCICTGGNIVSNFITQTSSENDPFFVEAGEILTLVNIGFSYYILSAPITARKSIQDLRQVVESLSQTVAQYNSDFLQFKETVSSNFDGLNSRISDDESTLSEQAGEIATLKTRVSATESQIASAETRLEVHDVNLADHETRISNNTSALTQAIQNISLLTTRVANLESFTTAIEARLSTVEAKIASFISVPKRSIIAVDLSSSQVTSNFDQTGLGMTGTEFEGYAICNGSNGTPQLAGRTLAMASSVGAITAPYASSSTVSGITPSAGWTPIPSSLVLNLQTYIGHFNFEASFKNLPKHNHFFPADDNLMKDFPYTSQYYQGCGRFDGGGYFPYDAVSSNAGTAYAYTTSYAIVNTAINSNGKVTSFNWGQDQSDTEDLYFTQPTYLTLFLMKIV